MGSPFELPLKRVRMIFVALILLAIRNAFPHPSLLALCVCARFFSVLSASEFELLNTSSTKKNDFFSTFNCFCYCTSSKLRRLAVYVFSGGFFSQWTLNITHELACSLTHSITKHNRFVSTSCVCLFVACVHVTCMYARTLLSRSV